LMLQKEIKRKKNTMLGQNINDINFKNKE